MFFCNTFLFKCHLYMSVKCSIEIEKRLDLICLLYGWEKRNWIVFRIAKENQCIEYSQRRKILKSFEYSSRLFFQSWSIVVRKRRIFGKHLSNQVYSREQLNRVVLQVEFVFNRCQSLVKWSNWKKFYCVDILEWSSSRVSILWCQ